LSTVENVEHLYFSIPDQGHYSLDVRSITAAAPVSYSLVWNVVLPDTYLAGDYDQNGVVDAADYLVWRKGLGTIYTPGDYDVWRSNFGQPAASGASSFSSAVPEPAAA
jgi:hypothetical protein